MSSNISHQYDSVCDALRDVHDEASLWKLSDELVVIAPKGVESVEQVVNQAKARGIPTKSTNTLRLYRDVAHRFPKGKRVTLVSFSAHREAIAIGDTDQAVTILEELAKQYGPEGVTVTTVKNAVQKATGKTPTTKAKTAAVKTTYADIALDLCTSNCNAFIADLDAIAALSGVTFDGLHAGLTNVLAQVEKRRAKAAAKAAADKAKAAKQGTTPVTRPTTGKPAATRRPSTKAAAGKAVAGKGKGDLRGL